MEFIVKNLAVIMTILFLVSELLGQSEKIRSSSVFGLIRDILRGEVLKAKPDLDKRLEGK